MIQPEEIQDGLNCRRLGKKIYTFETIDSTNNCARALAALGADEGTLVISEEQTAGRGRLGRSWTAEPGKNLIFSIILKPAIPPDEINLLPLGIAVSVARAVQKATALLPACKWPNDLLLGGRKFAGILMESAIGSAGLEYVVAGIGINVNQLEFPDPLKPLATSLALQSDGPHDRLVLLRTILESLEQDLDQYAESGFYTILPAWLTLAPIIGKHITADMQGTVVTGIVRGISTDGGLQVQTETGDITLFAGDVTITHMESYAPRN